MTRQLRKIMILVKEMITQLPAYSNPYSKGNYWLIAIDLSKQQVLFSIQLLNTFSTPAVTTKTLKK